MKCTSGPGDVHFIIGQNPIPIESFFKGLSKLNTGKGTCSDGLNVEVARQLPLPWLLLLHCHFGKIALGAEMPTAWVDILTYMLHKN
eukprot:6774614-Karenia_brevis.AAC.1